MKPQLPNFDTLRQLAENNPQELERLREDAIEQLINEAPEHMQRRLRGLQFQIDAQREMAKSPIDSCIRVSNMMHTSFANLREKLNAAVGQSGPLQGPRAIADYDEMPTQSAQVIPFNA